jgi:cytoplasmic iron level regulating protein YaaA (DUF328/UPF0246 family)
MLILISPAKRLNEVQGLPDNPERRPALLNEAHKINKVIRRISPADLMKLQGISRELAELNAARNVAWQAEPEGKVYSEAIMLFNGDVYAGLDAETLTDTDLNYASESLRILSGLYGILKPQDLIEPYRLEMGTSVAIGKHADLYDFWKSKISKQIQQEFDHQPIVNLASQEYSKAVDFKALKNRVVQVEFKNKNSQGEYRVMSFFAKKARGLMARYIIKNRIQDPDEITGFNDFGYSYHEALSKENYLVFLRD